MIDHRLPRARGDRPDLSPFRNTQWQSPPRTRGSTDYGATFSKVGPVSPAHAGIDPIRLHAPRVRQRLPRARGDRPVQYARWVERGTSPPRTRGSTVLGYPELSNSLDD